jgi:hypothetical protein
MSDWNGKDRRAMHDDFAQYKELILTEIKTLKMDFKEFKEKINDKITKIDVTLATINTKLMVGSGLTSLIVAGIVTGVVTFMTK